MVAAAVVRGQPESVEDGERRAFADEALLSVLPPALDVEEEAPEIELWPVGLGDTSW